MFCFQCEKRPKAKVVPRLVYVAKSPRLLRYKIY